MTEAAQTLEDALDLVADFDVDLDEEVLEEEAVDGVDAAAFCVEDFDNDDEDLDGDVDLEDDDLGDDKDLDGDPKGNFETDDFYLEMINDRHQIFFQFTQKTLGIRLVLII